MTNNRNIMKSSEWL